MAAITIMLVSAAFCTAYLMIGKNAAEKRVIEQTAGGFLKLVSEKKTDGAKALSAGIVLFNLTGTDQSPDKKHLVLEAKAHVISFGPSWAIVRGKVESISPANETSVHWYEMQLIKRRGNWKIYKLKETGPEIASDSCYNLRADAGTADKKACEEVFRQYCETVLEGQYAEAGKQLVGQAKNAHEISGGLFKEIYGGKTLCKDGIKNLETSMLAGDRETLILYAHYSINGKEIETAVSCCKTRKGWRIYDIAQI